MSDAGKKVIPRFFKVFLSENNKSIGIPVDFMEHIARPLPETAILRGTGGGFWTVSLSEESDSVYFTQGWSKFAEDHELNDGEFLTFVYDGRRTFEVSLFGRWGSKETRAEAETIELPDSESGAESEAGSESQYESEEEEEEEEEASMEEDDEDISFDKNEEISQSIYPLDTEAAIVAENVAPMTAMDMTNPSFTTTLKNRIYELLIPAIVVKEHDLVFGDTVKYIDVEGSLVGQRGKWSDDRICFKGWDRICRRNRLKTNDVVDCEILHDQSLVHSIRVHVRRGAAAA